LLAGFGAQSGVSLILLKLARIPCPPALYVLDPAFLATTMSCATQASLQSSVLFRVLMSGRAMRLPGPCISSRICRSCGRHQVLWIAAAGTYARARIKKMIEDEVFGIGSR
jgi:hypothetical protein